MVPMKSSVQPKEEVFEPRAFLAKVADGQTVTRYIERQAVFAQGDPADSIFYIHNGKVKVTVLSNHGKEAVVAILGTGQFFGEGCLAGQTHRMASVTAIRHRLCITLAVWRGGPARAERSLITLAWTSLSFATTRSPHSMYSSIQCRHDATECSRWI